MWFLECLKQFGKSGETQGMSRVLGWLVTNLKIHCLSLYFEHEERKLNKEIREGSFKYFAKKSFV